MSALHRDSAMNYFKGWQISKYPTQFSALVCFQMAEDGGELTVYRKRWNPKDDLAKEAERKAKLAKDKGPKNVAQIQFSEKTLYILPSSIVSVFLNISLNVLLIPAYGALGAVMALLFTSIFGSIVHLYFGFKLYPLPLKWWKLASMFLFTLIFFILLILTIFL